MTKEELSAEAEYEDYKDHLQYFFNCECRISALLESLRELIKALKKAELHLVVNNYNSALKEVMGAMPEAIELEGLLKNKGEE